MTDHEAESAKPVTQLVTLQDQIAAYQAQSAGRAPSEVSAAFANAIAQLVASGITENALKVGEQAPDFTLPDALGKSITLSQLLAKGPVVVTFYRGDWCPYCNLQLRAYEAILPSVHELGGELVAISPQTPDQSLTTAEKKGLTFPVLSDVGNVVARRYGLVYALAEELRPIYLRAGNDLPAFNGDESWELPVPGTFIIDRDGTVRLAFVDADYTHRLEPAALLDGLRASAKSSNAVEARRE